MMNETIEALKKTEKASATAIDLIIRQQAKIEELKAEKERLQQNLKEAHIDIKELLAVNERLNAEINLLKAKISVYEGWGSPQEKIKAEAYKEFAERLKNSKPLKYKGTLYFETFTNNEIDNLLKEMVGE